MRYLLWGLFGPSTWPLWLAALALFLLLRNRTTGAKRALAGSVILFVLFGLAPTGAILMERLESQHDLLEPPQNSHNILVLAGGEALYATKRRGELELNGHGDRIIAGAALARRSPTATLWIVGYGRETDLQANDVESVAAYWLNSGIPAEKIRAIGGSPDTCANLADFASASEGEAAILVTSAFHMPRAVACARKAGIDVQPYPVDYKTGIGGWPLEVLGNLQTLDLAAHEWVGLAYYRLTDRI